MRVTPGGMSILSLGLAVNDRVKDQQTGEWGDRPNYLDCVMFGKRAEAMQQYLRKGTKVAVECRARWSSWEKDGQKRSKVEFVVDELVLMSRGDGQGQQAQPAYQPQRQPTYSAPAPQPQGYAQQPQGYAPQQPAYPAPEGVYDEDIPF